MAYRQRFFGGRTGAPRRATVLVGGIAALAAATALSACTATTGHDAQHDSASGPAQHSQDAPGSASPTPELAAQITSLPADGAAGVNPAQPVVIKVAHGTLRQVVMTNAAGKHVRGKMTAGNASWTTTEDLGYGKTYTVRATATDAAGHQVVKNETIKTLTPANQTTPYLQRIGGYPLDNGAKYGVGIVPIVHFDEPIKDKTAAEKAVTITTTPHVAGAWYWSDDQDAHWRPQHYWAPGTKVTVAAKVYGVKLGHGLYGSNDVSRSFTIGPKNITVAYDSAPKAVNKVRVYHSGKLVRTMNTSMGEHGGENTSNGYINFYTLDGAYTVIAHENPAKMCSASYGLPANAPGGYACEDIFWSSKISVDGIYLHELDTTTWAQNSGQDVSHGCLNLNHDNAEWFYNHSRIGDPVIIHGKKAAPTLQVWEGGDWTVPWSTWVKGGDV